MQSAPQAADFCRGTVTRPGLFKAGQTGKAPGMLALLRSCLFALVVFSATQSLAVEIIAHRGASADAPENSLSAMKLAWEQGADAIELDLWLSKDGKLIVFHDADTKRIGGVDRKITDYTLAEAAQIDVGAWKSPKFAGERMPTLESILATVPAGKRAVLELKSGQEIVPELVRAVRASGRKREQIVIISFNHEGLAESRRQLPEHEHFFLHGYKKDKAGEFPKLEPLIEKAKAAGYHGLNLHFDWPIDAAFVARLKKEGLKCLVWTVNDAAVARRMVEAGVVAITTDRPAWLREQLK